MHSKKRYLKQPLSADNIHKRLCVPKWRNW
jgi:hypothetical protein